MNQSDWNRNAYMPGRPLSRRGYMRWWHSFMGVCPDTGEHRVFFIEYFIINPSLGKSSPVLGQLAHNKKRGILPSYVMIKAGAFGNDTGAEPCQLHSFYPIRALHVAQKPFVMEAGSCFYSETHLKGLVAVSPSEAARKARMTDEGYMEWDLEIHKALSCHTGFLGNALTSVMGVLDSFWHGEGIKTFYQGRVLLNGVPYEVSPQSCCGYADKHWGRSFNSPWLQFASSSLTSERTGREWKHAALAVNGSCPRFLFFPLRRRLMIQLTYAGEDFDFGLSPFSIHCHAKWKVNRTSWGMKWKIVASNRDAIVKITGSCPWEEMLSLQYEAPDGSLPATPIMAGGTGRGTLLLYRRTPIGKQLADTLALENVFCSYGNVFR